MLEFRQLHFKGDLCRVPELTIQKVSRMGDSSPAQVINSREVRRTARQKRG